MKDTEIYEILIREHEKMLQAYVLGLVRDHALAEDVCQDAFVKAFQKLSTLKDKGAFPAWLRSIARNTAFTALEKRGREVPVEQEVLEGMEDVFLAFDRSRQGESWQERVGVVRDCLDALPEGLRTVCRSHYFDDRKAHEIAADSGLNVATVFKRLERARDAIRACFEHKMLARA